MTQLEIAEQRLQHAVERHVEHGTGYIPEDVSVAVADPVALRQILRHHCGQPEPILPPDVVSAYLDVLRLLRDECAVCHEVSPPSPGPA